MTGSALATPPTEFRCARCGYGICVSGALPPCPMCQTTTWEPSAYTTRGAGAEMSGTMEGRKDEGAAEKRAQTGAVVAGLYLHVAARRSRELRVGR